MASHSGPQFNLYSSKVITPSYGMNTINFTCLFTAVRNYPQICITKNPKYNIWRTQVLLYKNQHNLTQSSLMYPRKYKKTEKKVIDRSRNTFCLYCSQRVRELYYFYRFGFVFFSVNPIRYELHLIPNSISFVYYCKSIQKTTLQINISNV